MKKVLFLISSYFWAINFLLGAQEILIKPYLQPGNASSLAEDDLKMVSWLTTDSPQDFQVDYGTTHSYGQSAQPVSTPLKLGSQGNYLLYRAPLLHLPFDHTIYYRVKQSKRIIRETSFRTRSKESAKIKFFVLGDIGVETEDPKKIAYQIWQQKPDFGVVVGDIVYSTGLLSEYLDHYVDYYINTDEISPQHGAPLLGSVPFYYAIGNHDIGSPDLSQFPDGFAAFYLWQSPINGPKGLQLMPSVYGDSTQVSAFKEAAGASYPGLTNYSFDNGPAHFLILDANAHVDISNKIWRHWIKNDLLNTNAKWKFVFFHQPGFHSSSVHYEEQRMRAFAPLFEECGVDIVFAGHVHNYQRSKPFCFKPESKIEKMAIALRSGRKTKINGQFTIDQNFNGIDQTIPKGIIYIVTGAGGAALYDPELTHHPELWKHEAENWAPFTEKLISDRFSFSEVIVQENELTLHQIDQDGKTIDQCKITKRINP